MHVATMDHSEGDGTTVMPTTHSSSRVRGAEPLVCYQQLQQDQGQGGGPVPSPRLTQLSLIEEITWL